MNAKVKYGIWTVIAVIIAYNSVYFKKLDAMKAVAGDRFDAAAYARNYLLKVLPGMADKAIGCDRLLAGLQTDPQQTFKYSHALDIGSTRFFLVKGNGKITNIDENDIYLATDSSKAAIKIATEYIFGNAVRDASGVISINDFAGTADLNNISAEANKYIRQQILPTFKASAKKGDEVSFLGAVELNSSHLTISDAEIIPVSLKITR